MKLIRLVLNNMYALPYSIEIVFDLILKQIKELERIYGTETEVEFRYWEVAPLKYYDEVRQVLKIEEVTRMLKAIAKNGAITVVNEANSLKGEVWDDSDEQLKYRMPSFYTEKRKANRAHYDIIIHDSFKKYYEDKNVGQSNYGLMNNNPSVSDSKKKDEEIDSTTKKYFIKYTSDRYIMLDGKIELSRPQFNRNSERIFTYLYDNPNRKIDKEELERELKIKVDMKDLTNKIEKLGFKKGLKKAFFNIGVTTIEFKNPIEI